MKSIVPIMILLFLSLTHAETSTKREKATAIMLSTSGVLVTAFTIGDAVHDYKHWKNLENSQLESTESLKKPRMWRGKHYAGVTVGITLSITGILKVKSKLNDNYTAVDDIPADIFIVGSAATALCTTIGLLSLQ